MPDAVDRQAPGQVDTSRPSRSPIGRPDPARRRGGELDRPRRPGRALVHDLDSERERPSRAEPGPAPPSRAEPEPVRLDGAEPPQTLRARLRDCRRPGRYKALERERRCALVRRPRCSAEKRRRPTLASEPSKTRHRPTLPQACACSTIGPEELNFRVRDGNGCDLFGIDARKKTGRSAKQGRHGVRRIQIRALG